MFPPVLLKDQITEDAEKYGSGHRQAILYRNLKNPLKQTMATAAHTGDIPREYR